MPEENPVGDAVEPQVFEHQALLGTVVEVRVGADNPGHAAIVDDVVIAEIVRLQAMFSSYDPTSEFCRWRLPRPLCHSAWPELWLESGERCENIESVRSS